MVNKYLLDYGIIRYSILGLEAVDGQIELSYRDVYSLTPIQEYEDYLR